MALFTRNGLYTRRAQLWPLVPTLLSCVCDLVQLLLMLFSACRLRVCVCYCVYVSVTETPKLTEKAIKRPIRQADSEHIARLNLHQSTHNCWPLFTRSKQNIRSNQWQTPTLRVQTVIKWRFAKMISVFAAGDREHWPNGP